MDKKGPGQDSLMRSPPIGHQTLTKANGAPSALLSDDVLRYILVLLAHDPIRNEEDQDWEWYKLAQVCRHWRTAALDTGAFWSNIILNTTSLDVVKAQLTRSKDACITLTCIQWDSTVIPFKFLRKVKAVSAHKGRIMNMYFRTCEALWDDFKALIDPFIQKMNTLHVRLARNYEDISPARKTVYLRDILSFKDMRELCITNSTLWAISLNNMRPLQSLVTLEFFDVVLDWRHLWEIIRLCPNMESLTIVPSIEYYDQPNVDEFDLSPYSQLGLPYLSNLVIYGLTTSQMRGLLQKIKLPFNSSWDLRCIVSSDFFNFSEDMIYFLFSHQHSERLQISLGHYKAEFRTESFMVNERQNCEAVMMLTTGLHFIHRSSRAVYTNAECFSFSSRIIRSTSWRAIRSFRFSFEEEYNDDDLDKWVNLFSSFQDLSSLEIVMPFSSHQNLGEISTVLIHFGCYNILTSSLRSLSIKSSSYDTEFIEDLKYFLQCVEHNSAKLAKLRIENSKSAIRADSPDLEGIYNSLSDYAQELRVEMYRSEWSMYHSEMDEWITT